MTNASVQNIAKLVVLTFACVVFVFGMVFILPSSTQDSPAEWVEIQNGSRTVHAYTVRPQGRDKSVAVILIHENRGLTEWERSVADRLGAEGYFAIAPDMLSGAGPNGGNTDSFSSTDAARNAINQLSSTQVIADLNAVAEYSRAHAASDGKFVVAGFCWGGANSFSLATENPDLTAAFVFYGSPPTGSSAFARINCPVYGFYGGSDSRITSTVPQTETQMAAASKQFEPETYAGAGHAFMRTGSEPGASGANKTAHDMAWERWLGILGSLQSGIADWDKQ